MKKTSFWILFFLPLFGFTQANVKDSTLNVSLLTFGYGYHFPEGDLVKRFGNNSSVGISYMYKTKTNWVFGIDFNYLFGNKVKEKSIFDNISTQDGNIIGETGAFADVEIYMRGLSSSLKIGKIFPCFGSNPNSGLIGTIGLGYFQHKIKIEDFSNSTPQVTGDYKKGYDRLSSGPAVSEFIGYQYLGNKRMINFFAGFEFTQAFTKSRRSFDFDLMRKDVTSRFDILYGIKAGWILPLYKKVPNEFYYY